MFRLLILSFLLNVFSVYASYYRNGNHVVQSDNVHKIIEKHDNTYIKGLDISLSDIESNDYKWLCGTSRGIECPTCQPMGDLPCRGAYGKTYGSIYDEDLNSNCACVLVTRDIQTNYVLYLKNGQKIEWDNLKFIETPSKHETYQDPNYNCSVLEKDYLIHKCYLDQDNTTTYKTDNYDTLTNITYTLLNADPELFKVNIDRTRGKVTVYYSDLDTLYSFSNKMTYELVFSPFYYMSKHSKDALVEFTIPHESFWRNMSLTWTVKTNDGWIFGTLPIADGVIQWYANERPDDIVVVNKCSLPCGAFCYKYTECMTDSQKNIKMAGFIVLASSLYFIMLSLFYLWSDNRKKIIRSGTTNLSRSKKYLLCIGILSIMTPCSDAWGTCTTSAFVQSELIEHTDSVDHNKFSGNMYLANVNGQSCFDVRSPTDSTVTIMKAILEITEANIIHTLKPQYTTYSSKVDVLIDEKCPVVLCSSITCDGICDNDRTCGNHLNVDQSHPGKSSCYEPEAAGDCFGSFSFVSCHRQRTLVGYSVVPKDWYTVMKVSSSSTIELHVRMSLDYLNGTVVSKEHVISASEPNLIAPVFVIGGVEFYNNGISQTETALARDSVMIHEGLENPGAYPLSTDHSYFIDASPATTKVKNMVGHLQCTADTREDCDFADDLCDIDVTRTGNEVNCGIDPVKSAATDNNELPLTIDDTVYHLSADLKTLVAKVENVGSLNLFMTGTSLFASEVVDVVPEMSLIGKTNGCFACTTGFWFKIKAKSSIDSGQAIISIASRKAGETRDVGIFNKIVALGTTFAEYDIHGYTQLEYNELVVTITSGENHDSFTLDFRAHFDDITAIATRSEVHIDYQDDSDSFIDDLASAFEGIGSFFSDFFSGSIFKWILIALAVILLLPLLGPLIGSLVSAIMKLFNPYTLLKK
jgi:hypothetical protein